MGKMGGSRHLKRLAAPGYWPVAKREKVWVVKPRPGPHPLDQGFPLLVVVRDILELATTAREAKRIIFMKKIWVDGKPRYDYKYQVGLMDVISIPDLGKHYRVVPDPYKFLKLVEIPESEAGLKVVKVKGKRTIRGGKIQVTTHDGRNFLLEPDSDLAKSIKVGYSLLIEVPSQEIKEVLPMEVGAVGAMIRGRMAGHIGIIKELAEFIELQDLDDPNLVYRGTAENVLVVGKEKQAIKVR
ncbi:MAG TPA: 30S ribosomal protein S4e [Candidatus Korarchaeota archaeon]|nr:30S ribosomal protein S4e [Candidatus Korarchaeota archaeon]